MRAKFSCLREHYNATHYALSTFAACAQATRAGRSLACATQLPLDIQNTSRRRCLSLPTQPIQGDWLHGTPAEWLRRLAGLSGLSARRTPGNGMAVFVALAPARRFRS